MYGSKYHQTQKQKAAGKLHLRAPYAEKVTARTLHINKSTTSV